MTNKKTITEKYEDMLKKYEDIFTDEEKAFLQDRAELHAKKNGNRKPTANQLKNKAIADELLEYLTNTKKHLQIKQMIKEVPCLASIPDCTPQYVMALIRPLHDKGNGVIKREEIKGTAYFYVE